MGPSNPVLQMAVQIPPYRNGQFYRCFAWDQIRINAKVDAITNAGM